MPVTIPVAEHGANSWKHGTVSSVPDFLGASCPSEIERCKEVVRCSVSESFLHENHITPSTNGFVWAAVRAYCDHQHLTLRPEDIWFSILTQLSFYINAHAEDLRNFFVAHEGQKELEIKVDADWHTAPFGPIAEQFTELMQKEIVDPDLRAWIIPSFSTTTPTDRVVASILMMGAMQNYFSFGVSMTCGLPSITLLGEREDWLNLQARIEKIGRLGEEAERFASLLRPIARYFVKSFDAPGDSDVNDFWQRIISYQRAGSGTDSISGWLMAFCFWNVDGKCIFREGRRDEYCEIDGVRYSTVDIDKIPSGTASVPVKVGEGNFRVNGTDCRMVAGSVGMHAFTRGGSGEQTTEPVLNSVQPLSGWWMFKAKSEEDLTREREEKEGKKQEEHAKFEAQLDAYRYSPKNIKAILRINSCLDHQNVETQVYLREIPSKWLENYVHSLPDDQRDSFAADCERWEKEEMEYYSLEAFEERFTDPSNPPTNADMALYIARLPVFYLRKYTDNLPEDKKLSLFKDYPGLKLKYDSYALEKEEMFTDGGDLFVRLRGLCTSQDRPAKRLKVL